MKILSHKLIITKVPYVSRYAADEQTKTLSVLMNHKECVEISCDIEEECSLIGNIYVGKVKNIVKNIDAAFVEIKKGVLCFLPLSEAEGAIFVTPKEQKKLVVGDELLVQVLKDGVKTKQNLDEGEFLTAEFIPLDRVKQMLKSGEIRDGKTVIALLSYFARTALEE